jgi:hypothetical protein
MKEIVTIKRNWNEVTLKEYFEILNILTDKTLDETEMIELIILVLTSTTPLQLSQVTQADYIKLIKSINFVFTEPVKNNCKDCLMINGKHFDVDIKLDKVTAGQYMMLQNIMKLEDFEERIKKSLGVFIRPQGVKWGEFDYDENVEYLLNNISIVDALSLSAFFLRTQNRLYKHFQIYMNKEMKREKKKLKNKE